MKNNDTNIAMLIDGDNAQATYLQEIIKEASKHGRITIKRIYGDCTSNGMVHWKEQLTNYSIKPIQKFAHTKGKNATDIVLTIDAMDILYTKNIHTFCIVSSDSDFTELANRIRENGLSVIGIGREQTPKSFINACDVFTFTETFDKSTPSNNSKIEPKKVNIQLLRKAYNMVEQKNNLVSLNRVCEAIRTLDQSFSPKTYGYSNFASMFKALTNEFEVIYTNNNSSISIKDKKSKSK